MSVGFEARELDKSVHLTSSFDLTREILIFSEAGPATEAWNMEASENSRLIIPVPVYRKQMGIYFFPPVKGK